MVDKTNCTEAAWLPQLLFHAVLHVSLSFLRDMCLLVEAVLDVVRLARERPPTLGGKRGTACTWL
jgi:hypothetical protein